MASLIRASSVWLVACLLWPLWNRSRWWWRCVVELITQVSVRHPPPSLSRVWRVGARWLWRVRWADWVQFSLSCMSRALSVSEDVLAVSGSNVFFGCSSVLERFKCTALKLFSSFDLVQEMWMDRIFNCI